MSEHAENTADSPPSMFQDLLMRMASGWQRVANGEITSDEFAAEFGKESFEHFNEGGGDVFLNYALEAFGNDFPPAEKS